MSRPPRPLRHRLLASAAACFFLLLLRHDGGGVVLAQRSSGDDDSTMSPTGVPSSEEASSEYPDCTGYASHIKDGYCDSDLNIASCGWDGGDCCACTCGQGLDSADELAHPCGLLGDGYDCQDPDVPADCGVTPSPAASFGYPDCDGYMYNFQNSYCNDDLNNARCGWDGGDCCRCTCREYGYFGYGYNSCGIVGYDCRDPEAPNDCGTDSPTPSPAATSGYPECEGFIFSIGDGYCDSSSGTNNEECGWDGGDCCRCECVGTGCGFYGFDCLDPAASTDCATSSVASSSSVGTSIYGSTTDPSCGWSGDGECDTDHNNETCDYDGGDCCSCDCEDAPFTCGISGFNCLDPSSSCFGSSSSGFVTYYSGDDDTTTGATSGWYHDDDVTSNSPGYNSVDSEDDVADDGSYYGDRDLSDSAGSAAIGTQDITLGSSESSFSEVEMAGLFVLSVSAFILGGLAILTACGFLRPRWCCLSGRKESAATAGAVAAGTDSSKRRGWSKSPPTPSGNIQQGPPSPKTEEAAEAAGDWALAAALRTSAAAAQADGVEEGASTDEHSAEGEEAGGVSGVGAQEGKNADEAELGRAFYGTGGTSFSQAGSTEGWDGAAATGDDKGNGSEAAVSEEEKDGGSSAVAGTGDGDDAAMEEKGEDGIEGDATEEAQVGGEAEGGAVEAEEGAKENGDSSAVENEEDEKQIEQGSAVGVAAGATNTGTPVDKPDAPTVP